MTTQLAGKFMEGIRGALNRTIPTNNDLDVTVAARTLTRLADNRFPIDCNRLINQSTRIDGEN